MGKVLIIEDEIEIAELERDYLHIAGFEADIETDGAEGLKKALTNDYDVYILDVMLPGVDGFEICSKLRSVKKTPIIMVSAKKDDIDKIRGLGYGADDYVVKPFSPSELVARVKAHVSRYESLVGKEQKNEIIKVRGLKIDKTAHRVFVNEEEKQFTSNEFELLLYLAENPNHVFTKDDLFLKIWGMESAGSDIATVTVHIKKIREKIEADSTAPQYIETIWGVGYRFKI